MIQFLFILLYLHIKREGPILLRSYRLHKNHPYLVVLQWKQLSFWETFEIFLCLNHLNIHIFQRRRPSHFREDQNLNFSPFIHSNLKATQIVFRSEYPSISGLHQCKDTFLEKSASTFFMIHTENHYQIYDNIRLNPLRVQTRPMFILVVTNNHVEYNVWQWWYILHS